MVKKGDSARKKSAECMALAAKAAVEERSNILRAMARSWMALANQMDRLEACEYRKSKPGHIGDEVRQESGVNR